MPYAGILRRFEAEAKRLEEFQHRCVFRQNFRSELLQSGFTRYRDEMTQERRSDALSLILVNHDKGQFGPALLRDDIASSSRDHGPAVLVDLRDQSYVIVKIDVHKERKLLLGEPALGHEKAALE